MAAQERVESESSQLTALTKVTAAAAAAVESAVAVAAVAAVAAAATACATAADLRIAFSACIAAVAVLVAGHAADAVPWTAATVSRGQVTCVALDQVVHAACEHPLASCAPASVEHTAPFGGPDLPSVHAAEKLASKSLDTQNSDSFQAGLVDSQPAFAQSHVVAFVAVPAPVSVLPHAGDDDDAVVRDAAPYPGTFAAAQQSYPVVSLHAT